MSYYRPYSIEQLERMPLPIAHGLLARLEREIDTFLARYVDESSIPGETYREKWERVREPEDVQNLHPVEQWARAEYISLAKLCRRMEAREIEQLRAERAA